jgi:hypothetical protein
VGFSLWRSPEGEIDVTFPSRAFGAGNERRSFDYLRRVNGGGAAAKALKEAIVAVYRAVPADPTTRCVVRSRSATCRGSRLTSL